jgi:hypothetical protein
MHRLRGNGRGLRLDWKTQSEIQLKTSKNIGCQENTKNDTQVIFFCHPSPHFDCFFGVSGRGGYGVGVNVMVLVNGQWLPGKAQRDAP